MTFLNTVEKVEEAARDAAQKDFIHKYRIERNRTSNEEAVKLAEKKVASLSRPPRSWIAKTSTKLQAMQDLILAQAHQKAYDKTSRLIRNEVPPEESFDANLVRDHGLFNQLFNEKEKGLPELQDLSSFFEKAQKDYDEKIMAKFNSTSEEEPKEESLSSRLNHLLSPKPKIEPQELEQDSDREARLQEAYDIAAFKVQNLGRFVSRKKENQAYQDMRQAEEALKDFKSSQNTPEPPPLRPVSPPPVGQPPPITPALHALGEEATKARDAKKSEEAEQLKAAEKPVKEVLETKAPHRPKAR